MIFIGSGRLLLVVAGVEACPLLTPRVDWTVPGPGGDYGHRQYRVFEFDTADRVSLHPVYFHRLYIGPWSFNAESGAMLVGGAAAVLGIGLVGLGWFRRKTE